LFRDQLFAPHANLGEHDVELPQGEILSPLGQPVLLAFIQPRFDPVEREDGDSEGRSSLHRQHRHLVHRREPGLHLGVILQLLRRNMIEGVPVRGTTLLKMDDQATELHQ
jgi:hypothetical protein